MILFQSDSLDPYRNLAIEEILLDRDGDEDPLLLLWRAADTVVIGKNQNPWQECDFARMRDHGVRLARRCTGGGAVYHDEGNLNVAFYCARSAYNRDDVYDAIIRAVRRFGVTATRSGKSSLAVGNRKVSGNAFAYRRDAVLHHGTLLIRSDLSRFVVLQPPVGLTVTTRAVKSEPADVTNLADLQPGIDIDAVASALIESFAETWGPVDRIQSERDEIGADVDRVAARLQSPEWLIGHGPDFVVHLTGTAPRGQLEMSLKSKNGRIAEMCIRGADSDTERFLQDRLRSVWFTDEAIRAATRGKASPPPAREAIDWLVRFAA